MLNLPKSTTIGVHAEIDGKNEYIELGSSLASLAPMLSSPGILQLISNSLAPAPEKLEDVDFIALAKAKPIWIYANGKLIVDPAKVTARDTKIKLKRIQPVEIVDKVDHKGIDIESIEKLKDTASRELSNFATQNRSNSEFLAWNQLCYSAQKVQTEINGIQAANTDQTNTIKFFTEGAHFQNKNLKTAKEFKDAIQEAIEVLNIIGTESALTSYDRNNKFVNGINTDYDVVLILSNKAKNALLDLPGLIASDSGLKAFLNGKLEKIMGLPTYTTSQLPKGVHFIILTTGLVGAYAYNLIADKIWASYEKKDQWRKDWQMQMSQSQYQGVVYDSYIVVAADEDITITEIKAQGLVGASKMTTLEDETYNAGQIDNENDKTGFSKLLNSVRGNNKKTSGSSKGSEDAVDTKTTEDAVDTKTTEDAVDTKTTEDAK